ncbi:hypothetical protein [Streptomyces virginiae]|uniref:hypothetical protein n=1 Tax=Streptomyces virginiae TaxID=1961 RepID=UPI00368C3AD0
MANFVGPLPRGVNLLVRSHPHNHQHYVREHMPLDVQVDHRDGSEAPGPNKAPVGERFNYQFEQPQTPEGSEPEHGG